MKRFEFKLEKVLEVRQLEEEQAQNHLARAQTRARMIESQLERLETVQQELYNFLRKKEELSIEESIQARTYLSSNRRKIEETEYNLQSQEKEVNRCRENFVQRRQKRQVLERLKEKDYNNYQKNLLLKQQKELDEVGQQVISRQGV